MLNEESTERRQREQSVQRLTAMVPELSGLMIDVHEFSDIACTKYKKRFHVASAPALFELRCNDERCTQGGYDITAEVMRALRASERHREGEGRCDGTTGTAYCERHITFAVFAEYRP